METGESSGELKKKARECLEQALTRLPTTDKEVHLHIGYFVFSHTLHNNNYTYHVHK